MGSPREQEDDADIRQLILRNTLEEVASRHEDAAADCCVICLDLVTEPCEAHPCGHRNFDYLCVSNWLFETPKCPLCKAQVVKVVHGPADAPVTTFFGQKKNAAAATTTTTTTSSTATGDSSLPQTFYTGDYERRARLRCPRPRRSGFREPRRPAVVSDAVSIRRSVYRHQRYSKHVGSNRLSRYRELAPHMFLADEELVSRARMWTRRELRVFSFLSADDPDESATQPDGPSASVSETQRRRRQRAINAEFLLEYIVAILKSVDIMGSGGQAEEMLSEFLGRDNTRLFLHELRAWLRSPFTKLEDWDRAVQYENIAETRALRDEAPRAGSAGVQRAESHHGHGFRQGGDFYRPGRRASLAARKEPRLARGQTRQTAEPPT